MDEREQQHKRNYFEVATTERLPLIGERTGPYRLGAVPLQRKRWVVAARGKENSSVFAESLEQFTALTKRCQDDQNAHGGGSLRSFITTAIRG